MKKFRNFIVTFISLLDIFGTSQRNIDMAL